MNFSPPSKAFLLEKNDVCGECNGRNGRMEGVSIYGKRIEVRLTEGISWGGGAYTAA